MAAESPSDKTVYRQVLEKVGEGSLANRDSLTPEETYRLSKKLARSVTAAHYPFAFDYSLREIEKLRHLKEAEHDRIREAWRAMHLKRALTPQGGIVWGAAAVVSFIFMFLPEVVAAVAALFWHHPIRLFTFRGIGVLVAFVLISTMDMFHDLVTATQNWNRYWEAYQEGVRQGVNRALHIAPDQEKTMWNDLVEANAARLHDAEAADEDDD